MTAESIIINARAEQRLWGSAVNAYRNLADNTPRRMVAVGTDGDPGMVVRYIAADGQVSMRQFGDDHRKF